MTREESFEDIEIESAPEYIIGTDGMVYKGDKMIGVAENIQMMDELENQAKKIFKEIDNYLEKADSKIAGLMVSRGIKNDIKPSYQDIKNKWLNKEVNKND